MQYIVYLKPEYKRKLDKIQTWERVDEVDMGDFDVHNMATHGMNRNLQRDIALFYDNLKPVQRRLLMSMAEMGCFPVPLTPQELKDIEKATKEAQRIEKAGGKPTGDIPTGSRAKNMEKAAGIVGDTLGKRHPHGDASAWKALIFMRQPWRHLLPLIEVKGNYGGAKNPNSHAQMRYVSCRLSAFAKDCFFDEWDLKSDLVDKRPTFTGKDTEPIYLPAKYPLFLMSWGSGIGSGLSTSSPGFLPQEAMQAVITLINDPDTDFVLYPEDPTGCTILDKKVFKKFVDHRQAIESDDNLKFRVRSTYSVTKDTIIIHNTPFEVSPIKIQETIVDLVNSNKLDGISDIDIYVRTGSIPQLGNSGDMADIIIDIKPGYDPHIIMERLYKATDLQKTFSLNCVYVALDKNVRYSLRESILKWIEFRRRTLKRMYRLRLSDSAKRIYVLDALIMIFDQDRSDELINIIKRNRRKDASELIINAFNVSDYQAKKLKAMSLDDLSPDAYEDYIDERKKLNVLIDNTQAILKKPKNINKIIIDQMQYGIETYSRQRLSKVINLVDTKVQDTEHTITITDTSFVKKLPLGETNFGALPEASKLIYVEHGVHSQAKIFMFTPNGKVFSEFVHKISTSSLEGVGMNIQRTSKHDNVSFIAAVSDVVGTKQCAIFVTRKGGVKQTKIDAYFATSQNSVAIKLVGDDSLVEVIKVNSEKDRILIYTKNGKCGLFDTKNITITSRTTVGVSGIRLDEGDEVVGACLVRPNDTHIVTISDKGEAKRFSLETSLTSMHRGDSGVSIMTKAEVLSTVFSVDAKTAVVPFIMGSEVKEFVVADLPIKNRLSNGEKVLNSLRGDKLIRILG
jgi:DNA gyrase subunit A